MNKNQTKTYRSLLLPTELFVFSSLVPLPMHRILNGKFKKSLQLPNSNALVSFTFITKAIQTKAQIFFTEIFYLPSEWN